MTSRNPCPYRRECWLGDVCGSRDAEPAERPGCFSPGKWEPAPEPPPSVLPPILPAARAPIVVEPDDEPADEPDDEPDAEYREGELF